MPRTRRLLGCVLTAISHLLLFCKSAILSGRLSRPEFHLKVIYMAIKRRGFVSAIIVAAGESNRIGVDKMMLELAGLPVLLHTLRAFEMSPVISEIVVVTRSEKLEQVAELCGAGGIAKLTTVMAGGETRTESVQNGLYAISRRATMVAIHDGARPLVSQQIIHDTVKRAEKYNAAAPGVSVKSTIKRVKNSVVIETPERAELYEIQTPQVFDVDLIKGAIAAAEKSGRKYTDDSAAVEAIGATVHITKGAYENMKLTTPEDLLLAETLLLAAMTMENGIPRISL